MKLTGNLLDLVPVFGSDLRPAKRVTSEELKLSGIGFASYGVSVGDIIQFPTNLAEYMFQQPTMVGGQNMQTLAGCMRGRDKNNLKPSYVAMGSLIRKDGHNDYTCDFTRMLGETYSNNDARVPALAGRTIVGVEPIAIDVVKFDRATRKPVRDAEYNIVLEPGVATKIEYQADEAK